jgi:hypothetical protein
MQGNAVEGGLHVAMSLLSNSSMREFAQRVANGARHVRLDVSTWESVDHDVCG